MTKIMSIAMLACMLALVFGSSSWSGQFGW